jgi:multiple sugar transport system permease protein
MRKNTFFEILVNFITIIAILWTLLPAWEIIKVSFETTKAVYLPSIFIDEFSLESYAAVITGSFYLCKYFWVQMKNSLIVSLGTVSSVVPVSLLTGYALSRIRFKLRGSVATLTMLTYLFPVAFIALPIYRIMNMYGLTNSFIGVVLAITAFSAPFSIWLVWDYASSIPEEIEEAARVDGASRIQLFTRIFLPLSYPIVITISVLNFLTAWNDYLISLLLLHDEKYFTLPLAIGNFFMTDAVEWNIFMAFGILYSLPALIFYAVFRRFIVGGLTRGSLKY